MVNGPDEITKALRAVPAVLKALTADLTSTAGQHRPGAGEWSIAEVIGHVADVEHHALQRTRRILTEDHPTLASFDHEQLVVDADHQHTPIPEGLRRHAALRHEHLAVLDDIEDQAWERTAEHDVHGEMSLFDYLLHVVCEEVDHLAQVAALRASATPQYRRVS